MGTSSSSDRFWVALPGRGKAVEMTAEELRGKHRRGDLPAGTLVARFGSSEWVAPDRALAQVELDPGRTSLEGPPSSAAQGVDAFEPPPEIAATIAGSLEPPPPEPEAKPASPVIEPTPKEPEPKKPRTLLVALASALVALAVSSAVLFAWLRYGYARGTVLEHVPPDCARLEYVDFSAIDGSTAMKGLVDRRDKALLDWIDDLDAKDEFRHTQDDDAKGRASATRALKKLGLHPYGDVKEIAFCEIRENDETERIVVVGGTFRGRNVLQAIREALVRRDRKAKEDRVQVEEVEGRPVLALDEQRSITMATGQVAIIGKKKIVARFLPAKPVARAYGIRDADVIVRKWAGADKLVGEERYELRGDKLAFVRTWTKDAPAGSDPKSIKENLQRIADKLRKYDGVDALADGYENAEVHLEGDEGRTEIVWSLADVRTATKALVDADLKGLEKSVEPLRLAQGAEYFHHLILPGVDYFELKLSPW